MLSVANVRSPSAAASYFAADNYYTGADADRSGTWVGKGAERLGLEGRVSAAQFDALLRGELPGGIQVATRARPTGREQTSHSHCRKAGRCLRWWVATSG